MNVTRCLSLTQPWATLGATSEMTTIFGLKVFFSPFCLKETDQPVRKYKIPRWQSIQKAALIQKKWNKRFGFVKEPCMFQTPYGLFVHPSLETQLNSILSAQGMQDAPHSDTVLSSPVTEGHENLPLKTWRTTLPESTI